MDYIAHLLYWNEFDEEFPDIVNGRAQLYFKTATQRNADVIAAQIKVDGSEAADQEEALEELPGATQKRIALISGRWDKLIPAPVRDALHAALPGATTIVSPRFGNQFGHSWWDVGKTEIWVQQIIQFLDKKI